MSQQSGLCGRLFALCLAILHTSSVAALSMDYLYRGNPFVEVEGITGLFSTSDRVSARFTLDCTVAHSEGTCRNLPYDDYFLLGAIDAKSMRFTAGPVVLPTADGRYEVSTFSFSTDYEGRIVNWDIDLFLREPLLNVDTDNVNGGIDSAGAPGEFANVMGQPGVWGNALSTAESDFDLVVTKTVDDAAPVGPQRAVEFTVSVANKGPGTVKDVVVIDQLPPELAIPEGMAAYTSAGYYDPDTGRWQVGDLDNSLPQVMTIPAIVEAEPQPTCIINAASTETEGDFYPGDNAASVAVRLPDTPGCADVMIEELFLYQYDTLCETDFPVGFQVRVRNAGPDVATNVVLDITQPRFQAPGLRIDNAACEGMRCTWQVLEVGRSWTASGVSEHINISGISDHFNVSETENWELSAKLSSGVEEDYNPGNNTRTDRILLDPHERAASCDIPARGPDWNLSGVGGGCFIATASYGSRWHPHVKTLRDFRDEVLMQSALGRELVAFYYRHSPAIACYITEHDGLRAVTRWLLTPIVWAIRYPWSALFVLMSLVVLLCAGLVRWRRKPVLSE